MEKNSTKEILQQSLLELSKSETIHFDTTAQQIASTRIALLKLEGQNVEEI